VNLKQRINRVGWLLISIWLISLSVAFFYSRSTIVFLVFIAIAGLSGFALLYYQNNREKQLQLKFSLEPAFDKVEWAIFCFGIVIPIVSLRLIFQFPEFPEVYYSFGTFVISVFLITLAIILHRNKRLKKNPAIA
jgi:hypothetical protein